MPMAGTINPQNLRRGDRVKLTGAAWAALRGQFRTIEGLDSVGRAYFRNRPDSGRLVADLEYGSDWSVSVVYRASETPEAASDWPPEHDEISHPSHYAEGRKYEPKDVIRDWGLGFNLGAVVKYVARAGRKAETPTLKDLRKARQFLDFEIEALEAEEAEAAK